MKLFVYLLEASGLPPCKSQSASVYAKLKIGKHNSRTRPVGSTVEPCWNQEFVFPLSDDDAQHASLQVSVFRQFESAGKELLGRCRILISSLLEEDEKISLPPTWFYLQPKHNASKSKSNNHGKILVTMSLVGFNKLIETNNNPQSNEPPIKSYNPDEKITLIPSHIQNSNTDNFTFEEAMETLKSRDESDNPENLQGGIVLNKSYAVKPKELNRIIFEPDSQFIKDLLDIQGTTDYKETPWTWSTVDQVHITRMVSYTKTASKFVKSVNGREEQTFLKADGENFVVLVRVQTPDVPFGDCFEVNLLYKISPEKDSSKLVVSYNIEFVKSTMMRSMIESSAYQGLKDNFETFEDILSRFVKPVCCDKDELLSQLRTIHQSDLELAVKYFCNYTVFFTLIMGVYVLVHIILSNPNGYKGLEFNGFDLPDSFGELITSGILFLLIERVINMISHFVQARFQRGRDNEVREHGEGWLLTIALIEGINLPSINSGSLDPYVMFNCNGVTKNSSVQLQTQDPQWNEIIEFDAMQEPPSVLDLEIFNFDGPFDSSVSIGHAEINFLKHTSDELSDMWVPLEGKMSQEPHSQLHLRVFLENNRGQETIKHYLTKMEKQVGKKLNIQSPHKNSTFQKLFGLPAEEYLIKDYSCSLKRKMPLQGRLFVSARILGFYSNLLGHKMKFFFMWEDVDDIQVAPPSFFTIGSPALVIILKPGRGLDARLGAKCQDEFGRLKFVFHSFVSFNTTCRTIKALWGSKGREEINNQEDEVDLDDKSDSLTDETESISNFEDVNLTRVFSIELPIHLHSLMEIFNGGNTETKIMSKVGCLDYSVTPWEEIKLKPSFLERQVSYKFNRYMSIFGSEVGSTQIKYPSTIGNGWTVDDVMTLHNVPFGDHFRIHLRYEMLCVQSELAPISQCDVFVGVEWLKRTKFKKRIMRNICDKLTQRSKEIFELAEREFASPKQDCR